MMFFEALFWLLLPLVATSVGYYLLVKPARAIAAIPAVRRVRKDTTPSEWAYGVVLVLAVLLLVSHFGVTR